MTDHEIRTLLERAADAAPELVVPDVAGFRARRTHRRRSLIAIAASVVVVVAVATLAVVLTRRSPASNDSATLPTDGHVTAQELTHYRWSTLPAAPVAPRSHAASVWTGAQMIVWGGSAGRKVFADGAAYTPSTNTWTTLPPSPLSARDDPYALWTGTVMIIWGGHQHGAGENLANGAMYDPATGRWTVMATPPPVWNGAPAPLDLVWSGDRAIRLAYGPFHPHVATAAFDPATNTWTDLPTLPATSRYGNVAAALVGSRLITWVSSRDSPVRSYVLDERAPRWTPAPLFPSAASCIDDAVPAGSGAIVYGSGLPCGTITGLPSPDRAWYVAVPSGRSVELARRVSSMYGSESVWTGAAALNADGYSFVLPPGSNSSGTTVIWDPAHNRAVPAERAPGIDGTSATWVWTGTELLGWGRFRPTPPHGRAISGLRFARP